MSNTLAIATVTASLQQLLLQAVNSEFPGANVTIGQPGPPAATPEPLVNICMYQLSPNLGWRNLDLPAKDTNGNWTNQPQLGIDLHYLFTFYGNEQDLEPQRLLGHVLQILYTQPVLTPDLIQSTIELPLYSYLANSDLANANYEQVKLIPQANPKEDVAQLWRDYFQTIPYSLSVAYQACLVVITANENLKPEVPVEQIVLEVFPVGGTASQAAADNILLPPINKANTLTLSISLVPNAKKGKLFSKTQPNNGSITGSIYIGRASDESDIEQYRLYWGASTGMKLANNKAIAILPKTGSNLVYQIPNPLPVPDGAQTIQVYTSNFQGEMKYAIYSFIPGFEAASGLQLSFERVSADTLSGSITILKASEETAIVAYNLYWSDTPSHTLSAIASIPPTGSDIVYSFPAPVQPPAEAKYVSVYTSNIVEQLDYGIVVGIPPLESASAVNLTNWLQNAAGQLMGEILITKANYEGDINYYRAYWGSDSQTKLANSPMIASVTATGGNLSYNLPAGTVWPVNANYLLIYTANDQAEMAVSISAPVPPLQKASAISLNLSQNSQHQTSGSIFITKALDERSITQYQLFWSADGNTAPGNWAFATLNANGTNLTYQLSPTMIPTGALYVLVITANNNAVMATGISAGIAPFSVPRGVLLTNFLEDNSDEVSGQIQVQAAQDETSLSAYTIYWGQDAVTKITTNPLITSLAKNGTDQTYSLPSGTLLPDSANYILVFSRNAQAEMTIGVNAPIPPLQTAGGIILQITQNASGQLSGTVLITKALDERSISQYNLYWSADGINSLATAFATLPKTGSNLQYILSAVTPPQTANYVLVRTANAALEMSSGINAPIPPFSAAQAVLLSDLVYAGGDLSGTITIVKAQNENGIRQYVLYWGSDPVTRLAGSNPLASLDVTGSNIVYPVNPPLARPSNAYYILAITKTTIEMETGVSVGIPPLSPPQEINANLTRNADNSVSGNIFITKALDESDITYYHIYWGSNTTTQLQTIANIPKTGSNLNYPLPAGTILPSNANYILAYAGNAQAEMGYGAHWGILPIDAAVAVNATLTRASGNTVTGTIDISKAMNEGSITEYRIYWSGDGSTVLSGTNLVTSLVKTGSNLQYTIATAIPLPAGAAYVLVLTANTVGQMTTGVSQLLLPIDLAGGISLSLSENTSNIVTGTITLTKAADEGLITAYNVYWGSSATNKLSLLTSLPKTGSNIVYTLPANTSLPANATDILVFTHNAAGEMANGINQLIPPLRPAQGVNLSVSLNANGTLSGTINITKATDETTLTQYRLFWGNSPTTPQANPFATLNKTGNNLQFTLTNISLPFLPAYVLVYTANSQSTMAVSVNALVPPLSMATAVSISASLSGNFLTGTILVNKAIYETTINRYILYWSQNGTQPLASTSPITTLNATGNNLSYTFPANSPPPPTEATYVLVLTSNGTAQMTQGVNTPIPPLRLAAGVSLANMTKNANNQIAGTVTISKASNESTLTHYNIYFGSDTVTKIGPMIASLPKTGSNLVYSLGAQTTVPLPAAYYILVFTANSMAEMQSNVSAAIPPLDAPTSVSLNLVANASNNVTGVITLAKAAYETTISSYRIYWSTNGTSNKLATIASLPVNNANQIYTMPATAPKPATASYVLAVGANGLGEMASGVSAPIPPLHPAGGVNLALTKAAGANNVSGTITIIKATDETDIVSYKLYWGSSATVKINATPFSTKAKTGANITVSLSPPITRPVGSTFVLCYTANALAEMPTNVRKGIPPLNPPAGVTLNLVKTANQISGKINITKATDESDITDYRIYWGSNASNKIATQPLIAILPKTGANLTYNITTPLTIPATATYILVRTRNAQAEMSYGVSAPLP